MIAGAFDHGDGTGIAHGETLAGDATETAFALDRAVEHGIADDVDSGDDARVGAGAYDDPSADRPLPKSLASPSSSKVTPCASHAPKLWPAVPVSFTWMSCRAALRGRNAAAEHRARGAVGVLDRGLDPYRRAAIERGLRLGDQPAVEDGVDLVILDFAIVGLRCGCWRVRLEEQPGKVEALLFQCSITWRLSSICRSADHLGEGAEAHLRHQLAHLFGDEEEEADDMLGLADEALAQHRVCGWPRQPGRC